MKNLLKLIYSVLIALVVLGLDQASKHYILGVLGTAGNKLHILPFIDFTLVFNYGLSFGTLNNPMQNQLILIFISLIIVGFLYTWLYRSPDNHLWLPVGMVTGGAFGNICDRVIHGAVVDFLDITILRWHYPTFNVADSFICLGIAALIFWPKPKAA